MTWLAHSFPSSAMPPGVASSGAAGSCDPRQLASFLPELSDQDDRFPYRGEAAPLLRGGTLLRPSTSGHSPMAPTTVYGLPSASTWVIVSAPAQPTALRS